MSNFASLTFAPGTTFGAQPRHNIMAGRPPIDPSLKGVNFNMKLSPPVMERLKEICYRKSVHAGKKHSTAALVTQWIEETPLPRKPTDAEIAAYEASRSEL
jgi:hypothetical protein